MPLPPTGLAWMAVLGFDLWKTLRTRAGVLSPLQPCSRQSRSPVKSLGLDTGRCWVRKLQPMGWNGEREKWITLLNWKGNGASDMVFLLNLSYFISSGCVWTHLVQLSSGSSAVKEKVWSVGVIDWVCMGLSELIYCFNVPVCCGNITYNWGMWLENVWWHTQVKEPSPPFFFSALLVVGLKPDTKSDDKPRFCVLPLKKQQQQQHKSTLEPVGKCRNSSLV